MAFINAEQPTIQTAAEIWDGPKKTKKQKKTQKQTLLRSQADCCLKLLMSSKGILNILGCNGIQDFKAIMHVQVASKRIKSESVADLGMLVPIYSNLFNEPVQMTIQFVSCCSKTFHFFSTLNWSHQAPAHVSIETFCKHG